MSQLPCKGTVSHIKHLTHSFHVSSMHKGCKGSCQSGKSPAEVSQASTEAGLTRPSFSWEMEGLGRRKESLPKKEKESKSFLAMEKLEMNQN